jgi:hypothetical protein
MCQFTPAAFSLQGVPGERERLLRAPRDLPDHGGQASPRRRRPRNDELASYLSSLCSFYSLVPFFLPTRCDHRFSPTSLPFGWFRASPFVCRFMNLTFSGCDINRFGCVVVL